MRNLHLTGPGAGAEKYDLLTAMAVAGLAAGGSLQNSMMRLMALVTARYNWAADEVSIGQRDMAALWAVDERTAKRETKRLLDAGFLELKRPGVRGRVAAYRLGIETIYNQSEARWTNAGRDFRDRMQTRAERTAPEPAKVVRVDFGPQPRADQGAEETGPWSAARSALETAHPRQFQAWFAHLRPGALEGDCLTLIAPSRFAAQYIGTHLMTALEAGLAVGYGRRLRCLLVAEG
jgi:hypothetical protein